MYATSTTSLEKGPGTGSQSSWTSSAVDICGKSFVLIPLAVLGNNLFLKRNFNSEANENIN